MHLGLVTKRWNEFHQEDYLQRESFALPVLQVRTILKSGSFGDQIIFHKRGLSR